MATGRGWILRQHSLGFQRAESEYSSIMQLSQMKEIRSWQFRKPNKSKSVIHFDSIPSEILLKIFSYLDVASLLCIGCVNKLFYDLSNDKTSALRWVILLKDQNGKEHEMDQADISFNETSVTVYWYNNEWPPLDTLSTLHLFGVIPVLSGKDKVHNSNGPWHRSLVSEYKLANMIKNAKMIGCDALVELYHFDQGFMLGLWKKDEIAFVMASLHYHQLIERSTFGSATLKHYGASIKAVPDDIDPEYGMHGYQLHIDLQSRGNNYICCTFRSLFCKKEYIRNGYLRLTVISYKKEVQHLPLDGNIGLSWRTDAFEGIIKSCFIMDLTLLDDSQKPFWCISVPVEMKLSDKSSTLYQSLGPCYCMNYKDSTGKVYMELIWMEETNEYLIVNLVIYLSTQKVNSRFGTNY
ncbi:hypothetical protein E2320_011243 [Naja naja]|nr:hypothetical protein E2320_011243 [Naja naja]